MIFFENSLNSVTFVCFVRSFDNLLIKVEKINDDTFNDFKNCALYDHRLQKKSFEIRKCFEKNRTIQSVNVTHETRNKK